jgi:hypothetical protein
MDRIDERLQQLKERQDGLLRSLLEMNAKAQLKRADEHLAQRLEQIATDAKALLERAEGRPAGK